MTSFDEQLAQTQAWMESPRFERITRLYSPRQVVQQRGTISQDYTVAREAARDAACKSNLRQFGQGFHIFAQQHREAFSTGSFDWLADGSITEVGWVADLVELNFTPGKQLCPSNPARGADALEQALSLSTSSPQFAAAATCVDVLGPPPKRAPDGTLVWNACRYLADPASPGAALGSGPSPARRDWVEQQVLLKSFNTNYTASWFFARSGVLLDPAGNLRVAKPGCSVPPPRPARTSGRLLCRCWFPSLMHPP